MKALLSPAALALACVGMAAACTSLDQPTPGFGNAVMHNMAAQVINPDPQPDMTLSEMDGERTKDAIQRYREGKVKRPAHMGTSSLGGAKGESK